MNDEPTNYTETCAKDLVRQGETGPVNEVEADGTAKQAKSKQKSEKEALKAAVDKADTAAHKAVSLAARAKATKAVSSVQTTSPQAICQVNIPHPQSPRGSPEACCEPPGPPGSTLALITLTRGIARNPNPAPNPSRKEACAARRKTVRSPLHPLCSMLRSQHPGKEARLELPHRHHPHRSRRRLLRRSHPAAGGGRPPFLERRRLSAAVDAGVLGHRDPAVRGERVVASLGHVPPFEPPQRAHMYSTPPLPC